MVIDLKAIVDWFKSLFMKPNHVIVPKVLVGSPDWQTPSIDNVSQNWFSYFSLPYSSQLAPSGFYQDNCVVRACIQTIEAQLNYYLKNNLFPENVATFLKNYYCNSLGFVKLSVRYTSKVSNVQLGLGTSIDNVLNGFAIHGLVPENIYPEPTGNYTWNEYMQPIPVGIENYGSYSTIFFKILWNALWSNNWGVPYVQSIKTALISSPVVFASQIGNIDVAGVEQPTSYHTYQHARVIGAEDGYQEVLDNYPLKGSELRKLSNNFPIATAVVVSVKII